MAERGNGSTEPSLPREAIPARPPERQCRVAAGILALTLLLGAGAAVSQAATTLVSGSGETGLGITVGTRSIASGANVNGLRHGMWRITHPDGSVEEGCYVAGLLHGEWALRDPADRIVARDRWCHGRSVGTGPVDEEDGLCGVVSPDACGRAER